MHVQSVFCGSPVWKMFARPTICFLLLSFVWLMIVDVTEGFKDLSEEEITKLNEIHLDSSKGKIRLYRGDSVSEFLRIAEKCKGGCDKCTVEPCNKYVLEEVETAYVIVKAFKSKLDSQYENIILMIMTATTICLSLYLWFVGHFSIRATWLYKLWYPDDQFQDPCQGIPMSLYTEMQFETLFSNDPRLKKIQQEEKNKLQKMKVEVDKSVDEFFEARPYLSKLRRDPSVLEDIMIMKRKYDKAEDSSSSSEEEQEDYVAHVDEKLEAEIVVQKYIEKNEHDKDGKTVTTRGEHAADNEQFPEEEDGATKSAYVKGIEQQHHAETRVHGHSMHPLGLQQVEDSVYHQIHRASRENHRRLSLGGEHLDHNRSLQALHLFQRRHSHPGSTRRASKYDDFKDEIKDDNSM